MFVRLGADWRRGLAAALDERSGTIIAEWQAAGRPFVIARHAPDDPPNAQRLGLALPDKRRLGLLVTTDAIVDAQAAPALEASESFAPPHWAPTLAAIRTAAADVTVRVYGSLAWQALTGEIYLHDASDLDLLLLPPNWAALVQVSRSLAEMSPPPRLDGEAVLPDGTGVSWREVASDATRLLVKGRDQVSLQTREAIASAFDGIAA